MQFLFRACAWQVVEINPDFSFLSVFQLNVNSKIVLHKIICLFFGGLHCDNMSRFYPFCANEAPSDVNTTLDGSTYPG